MFKNTEEMRIVFTAQSKQYFYCRDAICAYVLQQGFLPLNPFRIFDYFLGERVERNLIRRGNNNLVRLAHELWVFGIVADGVLFEIEYALSMKKMIRFFTINAKVEEILPITKLDDVKFESPIHSSGRTREELLQRIDASYYDPQLSLLAWKDAARLCMEPPNVLVPYPQDQRRTVIVTESATERRHELPPEEEEEDITENTRETIVSNEYSNGLAAQPDQGNLVLLKNS